MNDGFREVGAIDRAVNTLVQETMLQLSEKDSLKPLLDLIKPMFSMVLNKILHMYGSKGSASCQEVLDNNRALVSASLGLLSFTVLELAQIGKDPEHFKRAFDNVIKDTIENTP